MVAIRIENKRDSLMFAIAIGCVFLLIIGVTWVYWTYQSGPLPSEGQSTFHGTGSGTIGGDRGAFSKPGSASAGTLTGGTNDITSLWFFGTLIVSLLLLFGMTFRYYSHREMKQAERNWSKACDNFLTRMEIERLASDERMEESRMVWSRILNGEQAKVGDLVPNV